MKSADSIGTGEAVVATIFTSRLDIVIGFRELLRAKERLLVLTGFERISLRNLPLTFLAIFHSNLRSACD
jgi:hypothetical protein